MKNWYPFLFALLTLVGCSKSANIPAPAPATAELLLRSWAFTSITVQTDAKTYLIKGQTTDYDSVAFGKDGIYTYLAAGDHVSLPRQRAVGNWTLTGKTLTMVDGDKRPLRWTVTAITAADISLTSQQVLDNQVSYTPEERNLVAKAAILFNLQDKYFGGSLDISNEPEPKSYQIFLVGKAQ
jgi:hypothetical protein